MSEGLKKIYRNVIQVCYGKTAAGVRFLKCFVNSPKPEKKDGSLDPRFKGYLLWVDAETEKRYLVLSFGISDKMTDAQKGAGFTNGLYLDLTNKYHVEELIQS